MSYPYAAGAVIWMPINLTPPLPIGPGTRGDISFDLDWIATNMSSVWWANGGGSIGFGRATSAETPTFINDVEFLYIRAINGQMNAMLPPNTNDNVYGSVSKAFSDVPIVSEVSGLPIVENYGFFIVLGGESFLAGQSTSFGLSFSVFARVAATSSNNVTIDGPVVAHIYNNDGQQWNPATNHVIVDGTVDSHVFNNDGLTPGTWNPATNHVVVDEPVIAHAYNFDGSGWNASSGVSGETVVQLGFIKESLNPLAVMGPTLPQLLTYARPVPSISLRPVINTDDNSVSFIPFKSNDYPTSEYQEVRATNASGDGVAVTFDDTSAMALGKLRLALDSLAVNASCHTDGITAIAVKNSSDPTDHGIAVQGANPLLTLPIIVAQYADTPFTVKTNEDDYVNTRNFVFDNTLPVPEWVKEGESGVTSSVTVTGNVAVVNGTTPLVTSSTVTGTIGISGDVAVVNGTTALATTSTISLGSNPLSSNNPLPITGPVSATIMLGGAIVSGSNPLPVGGNTITNPVITKPYLKDASGAAQWSTLTGRVQGPEQAIINPDQVPVTGSGPDGSHDVNVVTMGIQTAPMWTATVKQSTPLMKNPTDASISIGLLGAGAKKGDGPTVKDILFTPEEYSRALETCGFSHFTVVSPDDTSFLYWMRGRLSIQKAVEFGANHIPVEKAVEIDVPVVDIGMIGAGASIGDGPEQNVVFCSNRYSPLALVEEEDCVGLLQDEVTALDNQFSSYLGNLFFREAVTPSSIPVTCSERKEDKENRPANKQHDEGENKKRKVDKTQDEKNRDHQSALSRLSMKFKSAHDLLGWLVTHTSADPSWVWQVISLVRKSNPEWDDTLPMAVCLALIENGHTMNEREGLISMIRALVNFTGINDILPYFMLCVSRHRVAGLADLLLDFTKAQIATGVHPPAPRLVGIHTNPGPVYDTIPASISGVKALPSIVSIVEAASGGDGLSGDEFDPILMAGMISGQAGYGNTLTDRVDTSMGVTTNVVGEDNVLVQSVFVNHPEMFSCALTYYADLATDLVRTPVRPSLYVVGNIAVGCPEYKDVLTPSGASTVTSIDKGSIRDNQTTQDQKYVRDMATYISQSPPTWGATLQSPLSKLQLYANTIACAESPNSVPWGNELQKANFRAIVDPTRIYTQPPTLTWGNEATSCETQGSWCMNTAQVPQPMLPFGNQLIPTVRFFITDSHVPAGEPRFHIPDVLIQNTWTGGMALAYALTAMSLTSYPLALGQVQVPCTNTAGTHPGRMDLLPFSNLVSIRGVDTLNLVLTVDTSSAPPNDTATAGVYVYEAPTWGDACFGFGAGEELEISVRTDLKTYNLAALAISWLRQLTRQGGHQVLWRFMTAFGRMFRSLDEIDNVWRFAATLSIRYPPLLNFPAGTPPVLNQGLPGGSLMTAAHGWSGVIMTGNFASTAYTVPHFTMAELNPVAWNRVGTGLFQSTNVPGSTLNPKTYYASPRQVQFAMLFSRNLAVATNGVRMFFGLPMGMWAELVQNSQFNAIFDELRSFFIGGSATAIGEAPPMGHVVSSVVTALTGMRMSCDRLGRTFFETITLPLDSINSPLQFTQANGYVYMDNVVPLFLSDVHMTLFSPKIFLENAPYLGFNKEQSGIDVAGSSSITFSDGSTTSPFEPQTSFIQLGQMSQVTNTGPHSWNSGIVASKFHGVLKTYDGQTLDAETVPAVDTFIAYARLTPDYSWGNGVVPPTLELTSTRNWIPVVDIQGRRVHMTAPSASTNAMLGTMAGVSFVSFPTWLIRNIIPTPTRLMNSAAPTGSRLKARAGRLNVSVAPTPDTPGGGAASTVAL